jgi:hypothetical protein
MLIDTRLINVVNYREQVSACLHCRIITANVVIRNILKLTPLVTLALSYSKAVYCNNELYALYYAPNIIRVIKQRWTRHVARMRGVYRTLVRKPE